MINAMPLNRPQRSALRRAVTMELGSGLGAVSSHLARWRERAGRIPDPLLRADAVNALDCKRGHIEGAGLFWTLPETRSGPLLRLLIAYELIYDYLDNVSERGAFVGVHNGVQLFGALRDALEPYEEVETDHYRFNPQHDDGGFLAELVRECRVACRVLPGFDVVAPFLRRETSRVAVLALNHELDDDERDAGLRAWTRDTFPEMDGWDWWELGAAASQSIVSFALLALATDEGATEEVAAAVYGAYFPWWAFAVTMLDSYVDQIEDRRTGAHSYVAHYPDGERSVERLCEAVQQAASRLLTLPGGERHTVLLACMVAMYLSKDSTRHPALRDGARQIRRSGGTLTTALFPVLRAWRIANGQAALT